MTMDHTPGPWETGQAHWNEDGDVMYTLHGIKEAKVSDCRLIGGAPDLLEAVKKLLATVENELHDADHALGVYEARAAIAKAEGRS